MLPLAPTTGASLLSVSVGLLLLLLEDGFTAAAPSACRLEPFLALLLLLPAALLLRGLLLLLPQLVLASAGVVGPGELSPAAGVDAAAAGCSQALLVAVVSCTAVEGTTLYTVPWAPAGLTLTTWQYTPDWSRTHSAVGTQMRRGWLVRLGACVPACSMQHTVWCQQVECWSAGLITDNSAAAAHREV